MSDDTLRPITVRIPEKTLVRLRKHAEKTGMSVSALARQYLIAAALRSTHDAQGFPTFIGIGASRDREPIDWNNWPPENWLDDERYAFKS